MRGVCDVCALAWLCMRACECVCLQLSLPCHRPFSSSLAPEQGNPSEVCVVCLLWRFRAFVSGCPDQCPAPSSVWVVSGGPL